MAYFYKNGNGIDSNAYIYVQLQVTRTDYPTYSRFSVKSVAVSDTGTSSFIRGQVTTNQGGTSWTAATGWKSVSYNGTTTLATASFDVARGSSDKTATCIAYAEGGGTGIYAGGTDYATLYVTVPKVLSPNTPTGCTATYVSDSQASISWTNGTADTDHPRDATLVERRDGSNEWAQIASVSGTASSYTDNGISPNGQYQYRVRAKNAAGYSAYSTSGSIYTTPASPASVTLDKTAATTVQVNATGTWVYAVTYDVELTYDSGATWSTVATSTSLPYSATVSGGTVQFRVRATRGALASAWTLSASIVTITPPLAPTIVQAPANPSAYGEQAEVAWTPNHPDGSAQESAEIKVTDPGGTSTTYTVTTATSYQLTPNATGTWTAQVRTKGLDPSYGEWSQSVSWAVANPPAVVITSPATDGTDINALPMTVSWTVTDSTGVSTQRIIIEGGSEILNRTLAGDVRTLSLTASDVDLVDGETYTIRIRVMGGSGLVTEQTRIFDVSWLAPTAPLLQITEGEGESASIDVMATTYPESGTVLEVSSAMMDALTIQGQSVQDGTPTPSAPVPIKSVGMENILDISNFPKATTTYLGCTITNNGDGTFTLSGTNTGSNAWGFNSTTGTQTLPAGTYTLSAGGTLEGCYLRVSIGGTLYQLMNNGYRTFTLDSPKNITQWIVTVYGSATISGTFRPTIVRGEHTRLPDMPYGEDMLSVDSVSKNIADISTGNGITESGGVYTGTAADFNINYGSNGEIAVARDHFPQTLAVSLEAYTDGNVGTNGNGLLISAARDDGTLAKYVITIPNNTTSWATFTGNIDGFSDVKRIRITFSSNGGNVWHIRNLCIRLDGSTEYVPHSFTTTPIPVTLRSLPDGTHDEWISGETEDTLVQRVGETMQAVTDGVTGTVGVDVLSSTGEIANGAQVLYKLATPVTTTLPHVNLPYVDGSAWVDAEVTPQIEATFRPVDFPDQPAADSVDVIRVNADGSTWTVASGLSVGDTAIDPLPPLGVPVEYRAVGTAPSGATSSGSYTETIGGREWVLNFGNAAQEHIEFVYNPQADLSLKQGGTPYHFADGGAGKGLPVFYPTTDRDYAGSLRFDTILYGDTDRVLDLCDRYPVAWLRDPFGHRWRAHVAPSVSHGVGQIWPVTLSWDAMRFEEAWDG